jgi:hypothetical protein
LVTASPAVLIFACIATIIAPCAAVSRSMRLPNLQSGDRELEAFEYGGIVW